MINETDISPAPPPLTERSSVLDVAGVGLVRAIVAVHSGVFLVSTLVAAAGVITADQLRRLIVNTQGAQAR